MRVKNWTKEEDEYIKENFGKVTLSNMSKVLKCSISTIQKRAASLGFEVTYKTVRRWTDEEITFLKISSTKYLNKTIAKRLNRPVNEVNKKARELGITLIFKRPIWKKWKVDYLVDNLNKMSLAKIMKSLEVGYHQIMDKIEELDLPYHNNRWTKEEEDILRELAPQYYIKSIAKLLNRTEGAVATKARKMNLNYITLERKYTEEELSFIKDNWGKIPVTDMARTIGVTRAMVQTQADLMHLPKLGNNPYQKWTDEKIEELRRLAKKKTITELAKKYKTTNEAIQTVASRNCITLIDEKVHWSEELNNKLKELARTMTINQIADEIGRSVGAVRTQLKRLGIKPQKNQEYEDSIWTEEDNNKLKELASQNKSILEICKLMNKKDNTIYKHARMLNIKIAKTESREWTEEDVTKLIELAKTMKLSELTFELNRSSSSIKEKARKLNIPLIMDRKPWTKDDINTLKQYVEVEKKDPKEIAKLMGRTEDSISIKINRLGLKISSNDKKFWTAEEEETLSDLWGTISIDKIAKKLDRTISSVKNKASQLGLGSQMENNYDGIRLPEVCKLFNVSANTVNIGWIALGLKTKTRYISNLTFYTYVEIKDLLSFLEMNQNIWDSRYLEKNILGKEPEWLAAKRKSDSKKPLGYFTIGKITKQQLLLAKKFVSDQMQLESLLDKETPTENPPEDIKKLSKKRGDSNETKV